MVKRRCGSRRCETLSGLWYWDVLNAWCVKRKVAFQLYLRWPHDLQSPTFGFCTNWFGNQDMDPLRAGFLVRIGEDVVYVVFAAVFSRQSTNRICHKNRDQQCISLACSGSQILHGKGTDSALDPFRERKMVDGTLRCPICRAMLTQQYGCVCGGKYTKAKPTTHASKDRYSECDSIEDMKPSRLLLFRLEV